MSYELSVTNQLYVDLTLLSINNHLKSLKEEHINYYIACMYFHFLITIIYNDL